MSVSFDVSELTRLAADLEREPQEVGSKVDRILKVGATKVKNRLRQEAQGVSRAPAFPYAITYESRVSSGGAIEYELGPEKGGAGSLALLYFGNRNSGPRLPDPNGALQAEGALIAGFIADVLGEGL